MSEQNPSNSGEIVWHVSRRSVLKAGAGVAAIVGGDLLVRPTLVGAAVAAPRRSPLDVSPPPLGWNSWGQFEAAIDEGLVRQQADAMVALGLRDAGYKYLVVDGGWRAAERDAAGNMQADPTKFPSGMKVLADYVHSKGLKFGLHQPAGTTDGSNSSPGTQTAPGDTYAEKAQHDAKTLVGWGIDFLKFDRNNFLFPDGTVSGAPDVDKITIRNGDATILSREAEAPGNIIEGGARVAASPAASGGRIVEAIGLEGGALTFTNLIVPSSGDYDIDLTLVHVNRGQWADLGTTEPYAVYVAANADSPQLNLPAGCHENGTVAIT